MAICTSGLHTAKGHLAVLFKVVHRKRRLPLSYQHRRSGTRTDGSLSGGSAIPHRYPLDYRTSISLSSSSPPFIRKRQPHPSRPLDLKLLVFQTIPRVKRHAFCPSSTYDGPELSAEVLFHSTLDLPPNSYNVYPLSWHLLSSTSPWPQLFFTSPYLWIWNEILISFLISSPSPSSNT